MYIQEIYDSEGSLCTNIIHKDENGKLNKLYEIVDFGECYELFKFDMLGNIEYLVDE